MHAVLQRIRLYFKGYIQEIFISYAWNDGHSETEDRERIVDELCDALIWDGYIVIRDKTTVKYKQQFSDLTRQIGNGRVVVVVISDKYLKSKNCMAELLAIYRNSSSKISNLKDRIFPIILDDVKIYTPHQRLEYLKYWENETAQLKAELANYYTWNAPSIVKLVRLYEDICSHIDFFTNLLSDMNTLNVKLLSRNSFQEIKTAIIQRTNQVPSANKLRRQRRISMTISVTLSVMVCTSLYTYFIQPSITNIYNPIVRSKDSPISRPISSEHTVSEKRPPVIVPPPPQPNPKFLNIHGLVTDNETGYPLDSAVVFINDIQYITEKGRYSVKLPLPTGLKKGGEVIFVCKYFKAGYRETVNTISRLVEESNLRLEEVRLNHLNQIP